MSGSASHRLFCFGYGYCAARLSRDLRAEGWRIAGTTRDPDKRDAMRAEGIDAYLFSNDKPLGDPAAFLADATHILVSVPPKDMGDAAFLFHEHDILKVPNIEWIGYLSSTSVYGDRGGGWVNETSDVHPSAQRGARRDIAEQQWLSLHKDHNLPVHVFRLAGIYGPGRSALEAVRAGTAAARRIDKPGHAFSRVHVDDIVQTLRASMAKPDPGGIYNICDDNPSPSHEVIAYACELLGLPVPPLEPFQETDMPPLVASFYKDNKRIRNDKIKSELGVSLKYPDYQSGLRACLEEAG